MTQITLTQPIDIPPRLIEEITRAAISDRVKHEALKLSVSLNDLVEMTGVSKSTLEKAFIPRQETKSIEYRVGSKRLWLYPEVKDVWRTFLKECV